MWIAGLVIYCVACVAFLLGVSIHNELVHRHTPHHH